jgi:hypothetical protein
MRTKVAGASAALLAVGLTVTALALSGASAPPDASFVVNAGARPPAPTGAELEDLHRYAEQEGLPVGDVIARGAGQNEFAALATAVQERYPAQFSSARWEPGEDSRGEIAFVDLPPDGAVDLIRASGQAVRVRVVGGRSEQAAVAAQVRAYGAARAVDGVQDASASVDPAGSTITITVGLDRSVRPADVERVLSEVGRVAEEAAADRSMRVEVAIGRVGSGD